MPVEVRLPSVLRDYARGEAPVTVAGTTVGEVLRALADEYPGVGAQLEADADDIPRFVNLYLNDEDIRYLDKMNTAVSDADVISILPAVAGG